MRACPVLLLAACLRTVEGGAPELDGRDVALTFLHTGDWHSRLLPYDLVVAATDQRLGLCGACEGSTACREACRRAGPFGGAARAATILRRERARAGRSLHVDSGDSFQGAPIFNVYNGEVEFRALSDVGLDAAVIGNHEFDLGGPNFVEKARQFAGFPLLGANYMLEPPAVPGSAAIAELAAPYVILHADGIRVGLIGLANVSSMSSVYQRDNSLGIVPLDFEQVLQEWVDFLRPQVELVAVVSHIGPREDEHLIERTEGVDVIFGGHLHIALNPPKVVYDCRPGTEIARRRGCDRRRRPVLLVHSGAFLKYIGKLETVLRQACRRDGGACADDDGGRRDWEIVAHDFELIPVACQSLSGRPGEDCAVPEDPRVLALLEPYAFELHAQINLVRVLAFTPQRIRRFATGAGDSALGNLVTESMLAPPSVQSDFAITNSLGIRADLDPGPITVEHLFNVFPFENTITTLILSGVEVQEMFDFIADRSAGRGCNSQSQISGATAVLDCNFRSPDAETPDAPCRPADDPFGERGWPCARDVTVGGSAAPCRADADCDCLRHEDGCQPGEIAGEICTRQRHPTEAGRRTCGRPITPLGSYQLAANDYIARGGSGFDVLRRNTSQVNLGISLREAVSDYMALQPLCAVEEDGAYLAPELAGLLYDLGERVAAGEDPVPVRDGLVGLIAGLAGYENYRLCADPDGDTALANYGRRDCRGLAPGEREACEVQQEISSALLCLVLPCVRGADDGRIERIFLGTSEEGGEQQEEQFIE